MDTSFHSGRSTGGRRLVAGLTAALALTIVAACSSASPTPSVSPSPSAAPTDTPAPWIWDGGYPTDVPTYEPTAWPTVEPFVPEDSPTAELTSGPEPTPRPVTKFKTKPLKLDQLLGKAAAPAPASDHGLAAGTAINDFGFDLMRRLSPNGNLVFSPTSIQIALAMARPGAKGTTAAEMDAVMRNFGADDQAGEIVALLRALANDNLAVEDWDSSGKPFMNQVCRLDLANAAFLQHDFGAEQAYLDALSSRFASPLYLVDFEDATEKARQSINDWVYNHTHGRIPELLADGDVDELTVFSLVNAMYLEAKWVNEFDKFASKSLPFTRPDGTKVSVATMAEYVYGMYYAAGTGWRAVELPLTAGADGNPLMSMTVILPDNMASFTSTLDAATLAAIWKAEKKYAVTLTLPRFHANTHFNLSQVLQAMGMPTPFSPSLADFTGINPDPSLKLHIQNVIHQANIDVNEEGVKAAAATAVEGGKGSAGDAPKLPSVTVHVDHPFLFLIHDTATGAVLFAGRMSDPSKSS